MAVGRISVLTAAAAGLLAVSGLVAQAAAGSTAAPAFTRMAQLLPGSVPASAQELGSVASAQQVPLKVVLAPSDPQGVSSLLSELYQPRSAEYHQWLKPGEFAARFGPSAAEVAKVETWLTSAGATGISVSGFAVNATLPAVKVGTKLGAPLQRYQLASGQTGFRATSAPLVPTDLAADVSSILGLDTLTTQEPEGLAATPATQHVTQPAAAQTAACPAAQKVANQGFWTFPQLSGLYGVSSLFSHGQSGKGQTIALYELSPHSATDVNAYESCFGLTTPVSTTEIDGGGTVDADGTVEADVDVEQAATQAPDSSIVSYEGPNTDAGAYDVWAQMAADDTAQVISSSWGECEPEAQNDGEIPSLTTVFEQLATQGQTVLVAAGDSGSEDCYAQTGSTATYVDYPGSDPYVTTAGGTSLFGAGNEVAWNWCQKTEGTACANSYDGKGAGGGGQSRYEARPTYQPSLLTWQTAQACGTQCREVPDISANSGVGMVSYAGGGWTAIGGTSLAAPFLAGLVADTNTGCATTAGLWTSSLYTLAARGVYGTALTDITSGNTDLLGTNNKAYTAKTGYDAATGLGSPKAQGLSCPDITAVSPASAPAGTKVTLTGLGLEKAAISFGGTAAATVTRTATSATVVVPAGTGTETVTAFSPTGTGTSTRTFTYTAKIAAATGNGQKAIVKHAFGALLRATVTGAGGSADSGVPVTFTVNKAGAAAFPGGKKTVTVTASSSGTATAPKLTAGGVTGTFTVTASTPSVPGAASYALKVIPDQANLAVAVHGPKSAADGSKLKVTVSVHNGGPVAAGKVTTKLTLPAGLAVVSAPGAKHSGSTLTWTSSSLAVAKTAPYTLELKATHASGTATVSVKTSSSLKDPNTANNKASLTLKFT